jgi:hypothetical protein
MYPLRLFGIRMSDEASDTIGGGLRNWLGALGFIVPLIGAEIIREGGQKWIGAVLIVSGLPIYWSPAIWKRLRRGKPAPTELAPLGYLDDEDSDLGSAIRDMARCSAWGKGIAAQYLATNDHHPASEEHVMQIAASLVHNALMDGRLEAQGRKRGQLDYEPIPRTHWRSTGLYMIKDNRTTTWKMVLIPAGCFEIHPDGTVVGYDQEAVQRTDRLAADMIVSARQFEKLWPRKDKDTDIARKRLLKTARKAGADPAEIEKLSRDFSQWQFLRLKRFHTIIDRLWR